MRRLAALLVTLMAAACAYDTPLRPVGFAVRHAGFERDATQPVVIHTAQGWDVTLTAAEVAVGPIYLYNAPPTAGTTDANGRVVAEVLAQFTVNALDPSPVAIATRGSGVNESALSAEVRLYEASDGPIAAAGGPGNAVAHVAGTASRGGETVAFDGALVLPTGGSTTAYERSLQHRVQHVPVSVTPSDQGALLVRVDPTHWFDSAEFTASTDFATPTGAIQLLSGVGASSGVFAFSWEMR